VSIETEPLFRSEVVDTRRQRVHGEIILSQPVRARVPVLLLVGVIVALALWVTLGTYTRSETARGILVTGDASAKIVAVRPGQVIQLLVSDGSLVVTARPATPIHLAAVEEPKVETSLVPATA
jgi:membrane fusion protein